MKQTLLLLIALVLFAACRKRPSAPLLRTRYTKNMAGTRYWRGSYVHSIYVSFPSHYEVDTGSFLDTFAIKVINDSNIIIDHVLDGRSGDGVLSFKGDTLTYVARGDTANTLVFWRRIPWSTDYHEVTYNYKENTITDTTRYSNTYDSHYIYLETP